MTDLRFAFRQIWKHPGFSIIAILTLALGIGANTAIFSVVNGVLLRPLPYKEPDKIVTVLHDGRNPVAPADFYDWREQSQSFEKLAAVEMWGGTFTGDERPENISGIRMGEGTLELLGSTPLHGRIFTAEDYQPGSSSVILLSHQLWLRRFGGNGKVVGNNVTIDNHSYTVIGVMPPEFQFPPFWAANSQMWAPLSLTDRAANRGGNSLRVIGRLKSGVTLQQAQAEMDAICQRLASAYPESNAGRTVLVEPILDKVVGDFRSALLVLSGAVGLVLLIACANVANLLLVRAAAREREMAIRAALGASYWRTIRQLLTESLVIALIGGSLGLVVGFYGVAILKGLANVGGGSLLPRMRDIAIDWPTLFFTLGVAALTSLIFGLVPAFHATRHNLQGTLKESSRSLSSGRMRAGLIVAEISLAFVMLIGAGLLMRSFVKLATIDPGFETHNLVSMTVSLAGQNDFVGTKREVFFQQIAEKIKALPNVESVSAINHLPLAGDQWGLKMAIEGRPKAAPGEDAHAVYRVCYPQYFSTMGMQLLQGRDITAQDRLGGHRVVVINEALAREQFPHENPVGKRLTLDDPADNPTWFTIVGVVNDVKQRSWSGTISPEVYVPWLQSENYLEQTAGHFAYLTFVIRTKAPQTLKTVIPQIVWDLNKNAPVSNVVTLTEVAANAVWQQRFNLILMGIFAGMAFTLAAVGIYGVMAFSVAQRTQEIGIRMALGACRREVITLVIGQGMRMAVVGVVLGVLGAFALSQIFQGMLFEISPFDPSTFAVVSVLLLATSLLACWLPARRATQVNPLEALRTE